MNRSGLFLLTALSWLWCLALGHGAAAQPVSLKDPSGGTHVLFEPSQSAATVVVFVQPDCPIANQYAPVLRRLHREFQKKGVSLFFVYADKDLPAEAVVRHQREFDLPGTALLDPDHILVKRTGATVTPEAVVFDGKGTQVYRGRIDNRYVDFGKKRPRPTQHDVQEALEAVLKGQPVAHPTTKAVGCYIDKGKPAN